MNNNKTTTKGNETNQTLVIVSTTINSNEIISTSTVLINVITIDQINTTIIDKNRPSKRTYFLNKLNLIHSFLFLSLLNSIIEITLVDNRCCYSDHSNRY